MFDFGNANEGQRAAISTFHGIPHDLNSGREEFRELVR